MAQSIFLATASYDRNIKLWRVNPVEQTKTFNFHPEVQVNCLTVSPDRTRLAAAGYTTIKVYDLAALTDGPASAPNAPASAVVSQLGDAHSANITAIGFVKITQGPYMLYSVGEDGHCKLWETRGPQLRLRRSFELKEPINCATLLHNSLIICGSQLGTIGVWSFNVTADVPTRNADGLIDSVTYLHDDPAIRSLALTPGGDVVVAGTNSGRVLVFAISKAAMPRQRQAGAAAEDEATAAAIPSAASPSDTTGAASPVAQQPTFPAVSPPGLEVHNVSLHTADSGALGPGTSALKPVIQPGFGVLRLIWSFDAHSRYVLKCSISPNGALLCTASADTTVNLWKVPEELPRLVEDSATMAMPRTDKWPLTRTLAGAPAVGVGLRLQPLLILRRDRVVRPHGSVVAGRIRKAGGYFRGSPKTRHMHRPR